MKIYGLDDLEKVMEEEFKSYKGYKLLSSRWTQTTGGIVASAFNLDLDKTVYVIISGEDLWDRVGDAIEEAVEKLKRFIDIEEGKL